MNVPDAAREAAVFPGGGGAYPQEQLSSIAVPPISYNNPAPAMATAGTDTITAAWISSSHSQNGATVKSTFIPTLPDELPLKMGEMLRVLNVYDDGWALCANRMGEQGMVPLDCLDRIDIEVQDHRLSRRISSLGPKRY